MTDLNLKEYEEVPKEAVQASGAITFAWDRLGRPKTPFTKSGAKLMDVIIAVWQDCYPVDAKIWFEERQWYKNAEKRISEQVAQRTGRSLASYPLPVYQIMKRVFKGFDPAERKNAMRMCKKWPIFQMANKL